MTVYVTGDIHGGVDMQKLRDWELGDSLTSDDYLIVAGDFGFPWDFSAEECTDIAWLESRPYTLLFVDGNHERFDHWAERPMELWHGGLTQRLSDTSPIRRLTRGEVFELDGSTVFTMGGATSVDKEYRIPYSSWWPQELPDERNFDEARTKLDRMGWKVDYVITHTCSTRMLLPTLYPAPGWNCLAVDQALVLRPFSSGCKPGRASHRALRLHRPPGRRAPALGCCVGAGIASASYDALGSYPTFQ